MLALEPANSFFRGACRLMACEHVIGDMISRVDDIFVMDEGPTQYDARPGIYDFGASKTGMMIDASNGIKTVSTQLVEITAGKINEMDQWDTLIAAFQRPDRAIRCFIFEGCRRAPIEIEFGGFQKSGEGMSIPVKWWFRDGRIMERSAIQGGTPKTPKTQTMTPDQARVAFDKWRLGQ